MYSKIKQFAESRGIDCLVHFTRTENLPTIMEDGLLDRTTLRKRGIKHLFNDSKRLDGVPDSVSCSVSFPNYKMFYKLRCNDSLIEWVVIRLKPEILWTKRCVFCVENAASRSVTQLSIEDRMTYGAFKKMYADDVDGCDGRTWRREWPYYSSCWGIKDHYPTHPQAEVLVRDSIDSDLFVDFVYGKEPSKLFQDIIQKNKSFSFYKNQSYFDKRPSFRKLR